METVIGFVVGYLVGAREGKGGLERLKTSVQAILASPEAHRLIGEAMQMAEPVARRASSAGLSGIGGIGGGVVRELVNRATGPKDSAHAA